MEGEFFEFDCDVGGAHSEAFARAEVDWNAVPTFAIDEEFGGDVGFGLGIFGDVFFFGVTFVLAEDEIFA